MKSLTLVSAIFMIGLLAGCAGEAEKKNVTNEKYDDCITKANKGDGSKADCAKYLE
jgi:hypothetical protein